MGFEHTALDGGDHLYRWYGKYAPGLCIVTGTAIQPFKSMREARSHDLPWTPADLVALNLEEEGWGATCLRGRFWISPKGTPCFRPDPQGPHLFLRQSYRRGCAHLPSVPQAVFYKAAISNGGGIGDIYLIVPATYRRALAAEDL